jgi:hypothetical protein
LLSVGIKEGSKLGGIPIFDFWARGKHPETVRHVRREIAKRRATVFKVNWKDLLPENFAQFQMIDYHAPAPF